MPPLGCLLNKEIKFHPLFDTWRKLLCAMKFSNGRVNTWVLLIRIQAVISLFIENKRIIWNECVVTIIRSQSVRTGLVRLLDMRRASLKLKWNNLKTGDWGSKSLPMWPINILFLSYHCQWYQNCRNIFSSGNYTY